MIELLIEPVKFFLSTGVDSFARSKELQNLRLACVDRLKREIRFNLEILREVTNISNNQRGKSVTDMDFADQENPSMTAKTSANQESKNVFYSRSNPPSYSKNVQYANNKNLSSQEQKALIVCLKTDAFDTINDSPLPVKLILPGNLNKESWPSHANKNQYIEWLKNDNTLQDLFERVYFRIHVNKALAPHSSKSRDYEYIAYMLRCLMQELNGLEEKKK